MSGFAQPEKMDEPALRPARTETIPLVVTNMPLDKLIGKLREIG